MHHINFTTEATRKADAAADPGARTPDARRPGRCGGPPSV